MRVKPKIFAYGVGCKNGQRVSHILAVLGGEKLRLHAGFVPFVTAVVPDACKTIKVVSNAFFLGHQKLIMWRW